MGLVVLIKNNDSRGAYRLVRLRSAVFLVGSSGGLAVSRQIVLKAIVGTSSSMILGFALHTGCVLYSDKSDKRESTGKWIHCFWNMLQSLCFQRFLWFSSVGLFCVLQRQERQEGI